MTYAMMAKRTKLMPLKRHRRSQNPRVLVDELIAVVDALMGISALSRRVTGARAVATRDSRGKKRPAKRVPRSAGFAICSPRGIREPHDFAPRGSVHLSDGAICLRAGRSQGQGGRGFPLELNVNSEAAP